MYAGMPHAHRTLLFLGCNRLGSAKHSFSQILAHKRNNWFYLSPCSLCCPGLPHQLCALGFSVPLGTVFSSSSALHLQHGPEPTELRGRVHYYPCWSRNKQLTVGFFSYHSRALQRKRATFNLRPSYGFKISIGPQNLGRTSVAHSQWRWNCDSYYF